MASHEKKKHPVKITLKCSKCDFLSATKKSLRLHNLLEHRLKRKIIEYVTGFEIQHRALLKQHKLVLKPKLFFSCLECKYHNENLSALKLHQIEHGCKNSNPNIKDALGEKKTAYEPISILDLIKPYKNLTYIKSKNKIFFNLCYDKTEKARLSNGRYIHTGLFNTEKVKEPLVDMDSSPNKYFRWLKQKK